MDKKKLYYILKSFLKEFQMEHLYKCKERNMCVCVSVRDSDFGWGK